MFTKIDSIPRDFTKYYRADTLQQFISSGVADISEVELFETYAIQLLVANGYKFLGWAIVRPRYLSTIADSGCGVLAIVKNQEGKKQLIHINDDEIIAVTREDIDNLFSN